MSRALTSEIILFGLTLLALLVQFSAVFLWLHPQHEEDVLASGMVTFTNYDAHTEPIVEQVSLSHDDRNISLHIAEQVDPLHTNSNRSNHTLNAVIHIGPYKTATTAIQEYSRKFSADLLKDGYEMPWKHLKLSLMKKEAAQKGAIKKGKKPSSKIQDWWSKQVFFALCFFQNVPPSRMHLENPKGCRQDLLDAGIEIALKNENSLLVSAEQFSNTEMEGVKELHDYLANTWNNVTIVATYRRYYEWIVSFYHEKYKEVTLEDAIKANKTDRLFPSLYKELHNSNFKEEIEHKYTLPAVARYQKHFENVVVMNYHDKSKNILERFYCDVLPNATHTCEKLESQKKLSNSINRSENRIYEAMVYAAHRRGMISIPPARKLIVNPIAINVTKSIRQHQEETLNLTIDDFPRKCPPADMLEEIWNTSLEAERKFGGELMDESLMKDEFDKYSKSHFCETDIDVILQTPSWVDFFRDQNAKLQNNVYLQRVISHVVSTSVKKEGIEVKEDMIIAPKTLNAVIHIGPYKTATTAIQEYSGKLAQDLAKDGYEMPWTHLKQSLRKEPIPKGEKKVRVEDWWSKQMYFAFCFFQKVPSYRMRFEGLKLCQHKLLDAGIEIAENRHSILVSAEQFSNTEMEGVEELHNYLANRWDNVKIVATYRRYYEWIVSFYNEMYKGTLLDEVIKTNEADRLFPSLYKELHNSKFREEIQYKYTLSSVTRYQKHFENVVVMNYHDKNKSILKRFYCDVMPNATHTCEKLESLEQSDSINRSENRIYEELAYAAHRRGMISIPADMTIFKKDISEEKKKDAIANSIATSVAKSIRHHQEETLNLTIDDFPRKCPPADMLEGIWNTSLEAERKFGGESIDESALKDEFDKYCKSHFCEVDLDTVIKSPAWADFFRDENQRIKVRKLEMFKKVP